MSKQQILKRCAQSTNQIESRANRAQIEQRVRHTRKISDSAAAVDIAEAALADTAVVAVAGSVAVAVAANIVVAVRTRGVAAAAEAHIADIVTAAAAVAAAEEELMDSLTAKSARPQMDTKLSAAAAAAVGGAIAAALASHPALADVAEVDAAAESRLLCRHRAKDQIESQCAGRLAEPAALLLQRWA